MLKKSPGLAVQLASLAKRRDAAMTRFAPRKKMRMRWKGKWPNSGQLSTKKLVHVNSRNVTPALHTPLMSVTNAISSIIVIGALIQIAPPLTGGGADRPGGLILLLAVVGLALTAVNMFGGFAVTRRMLAMFRK